MRTGDAPIAIVGRGTVFPGARHPESFHHNLMRGRCLIREIPEWLWEKEIYFHDPKEHPVGSAAAIAGLVKDPALEYGTLRIPPAVAAYMSRSQKLALYCATEALRESGHLGSEDQTWRDRCSVIMAAISGGDQSEMSLQTVLEERFWKRLATLENPQKVEQMRETYDQAFPLQPITEDTLPGASPNLVAGRISSAFHLKGANLTLDAACASSLTAIHTAVRSLQSGEADMVVAGGVDTWVDVSAFILFSKITALSSNGCFPFDARASGLAIGEGCGLLLLKREEDAIRDGNAIYGRILGVGASSDGAGRGITVPDSGGQFLALERAYEDAQIDPASLDYVECHGTGTKVGDPTELESIRRLLATTDRPTDRPLPVGSVKGSVGHLRTAAGMAGMVNALESMRRGWVPPQVNFETPTPAFDWAGSGLTVNTRPLKIDPEHARLGVSGFGFGGTNCHIVLSGAPAAQARPVQIPVQQSLLPEPVPLEGDTAFLFPGQGAQAPGMIRELLEAGVGEERMAAAEEVVKRCTGESLRERMLADPENPESWDRLKTTEFAQPAILTASVILAEALKERGIQAHMMIGHSLGEYSALVMNGVMEFEEAVYAVTRRGQLMTEGSGEESILAYLLGDREEIEELLAEAPPGVTLANRNSLSQVVIAGPPDVLNRVIRQARDGNLQGDVLNVDRAFHSTYVSHAVAPMRKVLEELTFSPAQTPMPANVSQQVYPAPGAQDGREHTIDLLGKQIDHQVDFVSQIEWAYRCGIRRFVDVGPRRNLAGMVDDILQGRSFQVIGVDTGSGSLKTSLDAVASHLSQPLSFQRKPLPLPAPETFQTEEGFDPTLPPREQIRSVVARVSGYRKEDIGDDDEFETDLGMDSLKMVDILSRLSGTLHPGGTLNFRTLTTINRIVEAIESAPAQEAPQEIACWTNVLKPTPRTGARHPEPGGWKLEAIGTGPLPEGDWSGNGEHLLTLLRAKTELELCDAMGTLFQQIKTHRANGPVTQWRIWGEFPAPLQRTGYRALWGFVQSVKAEWPELTTGGLVFASLPSTWEEASSWLSEQEKVLLVPADGNTLAIDLAKLDLPSVPAEGAREIFGPDDVILVTGGAKGIAAEIVKDWLPKTNARFLLLGRNPQEQDWMREAGAGRITLLQADLGHPEAAASLDLSDVTWIWHAAGFTTLTPLNDRSEAEFRSVVDVKATGLLHLLEQIPPEQLKGMVHFSSIVAYVGNLAQADYACANGFLDGLRWKNVPQLSIGWTAWDEVGMASSGLTHDVVKSSGITFLPLQDGIRYFEECLHWWKGLPEGTSATLEVFAAPSSVTDKGEQVDESLLWVNPEGTATPVFMICGIFGFGYRLQVIAKLADESIPFGILQPPGMDWGTKQIQDISGMAAWYADRIESERPEGPLSLLGTSFGGNMVFEVALLLQQRGRTVERLMMVDAMPPEEDQLEHDALQVNIDRLREEANSPIEHAGVDMADFQLSALLRHTPEGLFRGAIDFFIAIKNGYPAEQDRRFFWQHHATEGMRLIPINAVHGGFAQHPAREELAELLSKRIADPDLADPDVSSFTSQVAEGVATPPTSPGKPSSAGLDLQLRYNSRFFVRGRSQDSVWVWREDQLLHRLDSTDGTFEGVVDVFSLNPQNGESFDLLTRENGEWVTLGRVVWPIESPEEPTGWHARLKNWKDALQGT